MWKCKKHGEKGNFVCKGCLTAKYMNQVGFGHKSKYVLVEWKENKNNEKDDIPDWFWFLLAIFFTIVFILSYHFGLGRFD